VSPNFLHFVAVNQSVIAAASVVVLGLLLFLQGLFLFARKRLRTPVSSISVSAVAPGPATISGAATGSRTLAAPVTGEDCFAYRTTVWQKDPDSSEWKNVAEETGHLTFILEDPTGKLSVEPGGAELDLRKCFHEEYAPFSKESAGQHAIPAHVFGFLARSGVVPDRATRVEECCLRPAAPVFVTGTITENAVSPVAAASLSIKKTTNGNTPTELRHSDSNPNLPVLASGPEVIRLSSGAAPSSTVHMTQQAKIAAALSRAELANPDIWSSVEPSSPAIKEKAPVDRDAALQSLATSIDSIVVENHRLQDPAADLTSAVDSTATSRFTMTKGPDGSTFIISNRSRTASPSLGWQSVLLVVIGSTIATLGLGIFLLRQRIYWLWP